MILNVDIDETGIVESTILPLYIDDYITKPATGELANYILDYIAMKSKALDTYIHVDTDNHYAVVTIDSNSMVREHTNYFLYSFSHEQTEINGTIVQKWDPMKINSPGSLSELISGNADIAYYRIGREKIWMNNFEDEGSSLWNLNSESETLQDSIFRRGKKSLLHERSFNSPSNIVTNLEDRIPFRNDLAHTLHGYIKTINGKDVTIEARYFDSRSGESLFTASMQDSLNGDESWKKYWTEIPKVEDSEFIDIRMNSGIPDSGNSRSYFDDVGLIEWDSIRSVSNFPVPITYPNDYHYIQFFTEESDEFLEIEVSNSIIGDLGPLISIPMVTNPTIISPGYFYFFQESKGPVGELEWSSNSVIFSKENSPMLFIENSGLYQISLKIKGPFGEENTNTISVVALQDGEQQYVHGDVNGDGIITVVDALLCANYTLGLVDFEPVEFLAADLDGNSLINVLDILLISDISN